MKIIFLSHWFPPCNEIGAVRPYEMTRFLVSAGHDVTVVTSSGNCSPQTYQPNMSGINVIRVQIPRIMRYADSPSQNLFKRLIKRLFYPDPFILMKRKLLDEGRKAVSGKVDLVISSGLPFSTHVVARELSMHLKTAWIADNRDLWASTPYRRQFLGSQFIDLMYERRILNSASCCLVIGNGMLDELRRRLPTMKIHVLMNGADCSFGERVYSDYDRDKVSFVYTGTLYKGRRDVSPLLNALADENFRARVCFYGAEPEFVNQYAVRYHSVNICNGGRVSKQEIKKIQESANFLVLALGTHDFEKTVLTGKFFEYLETGRPIIALCDNDSELASLVKKYRLGCATRDWREISEFVRSVVSKNKWLGAVPKELTREYQMEKTLPSAIAKASTLGW